MESWTEIKISVDAKDIDRASDIANVVVPYGIYIEDYTNLEQEVEDIAHIDLIDEDLLAKDRNKAFVHIYLEPDVSPSEAVAFLSERYNAEGIKHSIELLDCLEEDWRNNWKKYFNPIEVGEKLLIRPSWRDDYDAGNRKVLNIDPGLAFGTGGHETTRLCLEMCEKYLKEGDSVLDVGCGSGILSIATLLLGADRAVGVDIDETAVRTAAENAEIKVEGVKNYEDYVLIGLMKRQKNKEELRKYCKDNEERISRMDASAYDMICIMLNREDLLEKKTKYLKEESEEYDMCKAMEDWAEECRNEGRASLLELISRMAAGGDAEFIVRLSEKEVMEAMTKKYEMEEILK